MTDTLIRGASGPVAPVTPVATRSMTAIGTSATVAVTDPDLADRALALMAEDLRQLDETCSRFRPDSEIRRVEQHADGRPMKVTALLFEALEVACRVAVLTAGTVDPTVGSALVALGYDRDFDELRPEGPGPFTRPGPAPGWWRIHLDPDHRTVAVPPGVHVDLGSTAKSLAADRAALRLSELLGCGVLVNLGGDVAVSGPPPPGGWAVGIAPHCTAPLDTVDQVVAIGGGGLASSGTTARSWVHDGKRVHHIVDPWTGEAAEAVWSLVSTTAPTCVEANAWSTAAVVWGEDAVGTLAALPVCARLVRPSGEVVRVGGWPAEAAEPDTAGPACRDHRDGQVR